MLEQLKQRFKEEVYELLDKLETILLELEKNMQDKEIIQEVFRIMHTIKGAAGMYEFHTTVELTHKLESIYALIRDKKALLSSKIVSLTFDSIDYIRKLVASDDNTENHNTDFNRFIERIDELDNQLNLHYDKKKKEQTNENTDNEDEDIIDLFDGFGDDEEEIIENATYYVLFQPEANIAERGINLNTIIEEVENFENDIKTFEHSLADEKKLETHFYLFWEFIIVTEKPISEIEDVFLFVEDEAQITKLSTSNLLAEDTFTAYLSENYQNSEAFELQKLQEVSLS